MKLYFSLLCFLFLFFSCSGIPKNQKTDLKSEKTNNSKTKQVESKNKLEIDTEDYLKLKINGNIVLYNEDLKNPKIEKNDKTTILVYDNIIVFIKMNDFFDIKIQSSKPDKINFKFLNEKSQSISLAQTEGELLDLSNIQYTVNSGLDSFSMPIFGVNSKNNTVSYMILENSDIYTSIKIKDKKQNLLSYKWGPDNLHDNFVLQVYSQKLNYIAPALRFRKYLDKGDKILTLKEKERLVPSSKKLYGMFQSYIFGDGNTLDFLKKLKDLNLKFLLLYQRKWDKDLDEWNKKKSYYAQDNPEFVKYAVDNGFLLGMYDSFNTMMSPKNADSDNVLFDGIYPQGCALDKDGTPYPGFAKRGCLLSSEFLKKSDNKIIFDRVKDWTKNGENAYFVDADATVSDRELVRDYNPKNPMKKLQDRKNRAQRLYDIMSNYKLTLGSEQAKWWAVNSIVFSNGSFSFFNSGLWKILKDRKLWGGYYPPNRPPIFFKKINKSPNYFSELRYNVTLHIPLFEAAFHDSLISTERWGPSMLKLPEFVKVKELEGILYMCPPIYALDIKELEDNKDEIKHYYDFLSNQLKIFKYSRIKSFSYLDDKRKVIKVIYDNNYTIIANFSSQKYKTQDSMSVKIQGDGKIFIYK